MPFTKIGGLCIAWLLAAYAHASGLDRTGQSLAPLFEKGRYFSIETYASHPDLQGSDAQGNSTGQVAASYAQWGLAYKQDLSPQTSALVMLTRPFGLDIRYDHSQSNLFGGTQAKVSAYELMGVIRHRLDERWALHGGLRLQRSEGHVTLSGTAYGALNGYRVDFRPSTKPGLMLGMSYEVPDIALRIVGTYYSAITHKLSSTESTQAGTSTTVSKSPQSFNLDWQMGVTASTLVFGQLRWTNWAQFKLSPQTFALGTKGKSLTDLDNATTYTVGIVQRLGGNWSGFVAVAFDPKNQKNPLSPLQPSNGRTGYTVGVNYQEALFKVIPWFSYQRLGGTDISSNQTPMASLGRGSAKAVGVRMGYYF